MTKDDMKRFNEGLVHMPSTPFNTAADDDWQVLTPIEKVIVVEPADSEVLENEIPSPNKDGGCIVVTPKTERKMFDVKCK